MKLSRLCGNLNEIYFENNTFTDESDLDLYRRGGGEVYFCMTQETKEWYERSVMDLGVAKHLEEKHVEEEIRFADEILQ